MGCKRKKFFAPYHLDQNLFAKWINENPHQKQKSYNSYQNIDKDEAPSSIQNHLTKSRLYC